MESRLRVQGHPIQPMLMTFPFGLFISATVFDLADVAGGPAFLGEVGYWTAIAALVATALAAVAGMVDLWDMRAGWTRRTAVTFNLVNLGMAALFVLSCLVRADSPERGATAMLVFTEIVALAVGGVGVALGARLMRQFDRTRIEPSGFETLDGVPPGGSTVEIARPPA
ncbi:Uncharacterized membrane protein [Micromonospora rhizosphaerae]|uniref:Uncharacterized membrane protein n=1 Tax=Micromonospora rhizosphaerae TaxID=568872 RepID=A0A1C6SGA5_9ACTN|nr:DUF2231 domain-containing protein [Micromonospora rhizosphaerae]SCL28368.1 Uncharacterized membrane protein [Micromonospora rhizosphaerae]